jgi:hypothetical protein
MFTVCLGFRPKRFGATVIDTTDLLLKAVLSF